MDLISITTSSNPWGIMYVLLNSFRTWQIKKSIEFLTVESYVWDFMHDPNAKILIEFKCVISIKNLLQNKFIDKIFGNFILILYLLVFNLIFFEPDVFSITHLPGISESKKNDLKNFETCIHTCTWTRIGLLTLSVIHKCKTAKKIIVAEIFKMRQWKAYQRQWIYEKPWQHLLPAMVTSHHRQRHQISCPWSSRLPQWTMTYSTL